MANLLKDSAIQVKMLEILGFAPTTLWTDIAWERLCELVGYDLSESEVKEVFQGGNDDKILYCIYNFIGIYIFIFNKAINCDITCDTYSFLLLRKRYQNENC